MTSVPQLIRDLIVVDDERGWFTIENRLKMSWDSLITGGTDRAKNRNYTTIDLAYSTYKKQLKDLGLQPGAPEETVLAQEIINSRKLWLREGRSESLYFSASDRQGNFARGIQILKASEKNALYESGTSSFFNSGKHPRNALNQLIESAENLLYEREERVALTILGEGTTPIWWTDGRTQKQALERYVNEEVADAYLFLMWINKRRGDVHAFKNSESAKKIKKDEDYATALIRSILQADRDPEELAQEISAARSIISTTRFNKQKYLLQKIDDLSAYKNADGTGGGLALQRFLTSPDSVESLKDRQKVGVTQSRICHIKNSHKNAVNIINGMSAAKRLFNATTEELSKLVPRIRLYKVKYDEKMNYRGEVEIKFPTETQVGGSIFDYNPNFASLVDKYNPKKFTKTKRDYGIQSFSWKYNGSDPFSIDRDIEASLELYFQDFAQFTALRGLTSKEIDEGKSLKKSDILTEGSYRYLDLLVPMNTKQSGKDSDLASKFDYGGNFHQDIRVVAGWEVPSSASEGLKKAVKKSQINFVLTPMDYSLSFAGNGNGSVVISIQYRARIESVGKNRLINVIAATEGEALDIKGFEDAINHKDSTDETKKDLRTRQAELYKEIKNKASKRFITKMLDNGSVYWRSVDIREVLTSTVGKTAAKKTYETLYPERGEFGLGTTYTDGLQLTLEGLQNSTSPTSTPLRDLALADDLVKLREEDNFLRGEKILYTFFGDIVQTAIEIACKNDNFLLAPSDVLKNLKLVTLDFKFAGKTYNLSNLPIEMSVFTEFLYNSIGKRDIQTKSIVSFISELLALVITNRIDTILHEEDGSSRSFKVGYQELSDEILGAYLYEYDLKSKFDIRLLTGGSKKRQCLIIYADNPLPKDYKIPDTKNGYKTKKAQDEEDGLYHFSLGSTKSLIKNISFDKKDLEFAREHRLTINQEDPYALLTNRFNVTIDMFGNNYFKPGSYVYVDPKVLGGIGQPYKKGSIANVMGLGGYHIVTSVSHTINGNSYSTNIEALWETSGDGLDIKDKEGSRSSKEEGKN